MGVASQLSFGKDASHGSSPSSWVERRSGEPLSHHRFVGVGGWRPVSFGAFGAGDIN